jgi:hypothetical protein
MAAVEAYLKPYGLHFRTTVLWMVLDFDAHQGIAFEVMHNLEKGMIEWLLHFLSTFLHIRPSD